MEAFRTILYIHGMGGGADSRIPSILSDCLGGAYKVVTRTYDFDPEKAQKQIAGWIDELRPAVLAGESLGAAHALAMHRRFCLPTVLVSPALNAPALLSALAPLTLIPGIGPLFDRIYRPRPGDRQALRFRFRTLRKWRSLRDELRAPAPESGVPLFAFFGTRDHYRRFGIVSLRGWRRRFGDARHAVYEGSHFMEEEYVRTLLADLLRDLAEGPC